MKRSVNTGRGKVNVDARLTFLIVKIPTAIACISTREKIIELCTIGQNFPAVSNLGAYTFMNCTTIFAEYQYATFKSNPLTCELKSTDLVAKDDESKTEVH